jgi:hypothetical protein
MGFRLARRFRKTEARLIDGIVQLPTRLSHPDTLNGRLFSNETVRSFASRNPEMKPL